jgi:hypothetical protein
VCESKHAAAAAGIRHTNNEKLSRPAQKEAAISRWGPKSHSPQIEFFIRESTRSEQMILCLNNFQADAFNLEKP